MVKVGYQVRARGWRKVTRIARILAADLAVIAGMFVQFGQFLETRFEERDTR